ncbi:MAG: ABC transporter ATP-binding protein [Anaerolineales bacterium]
MISIQNLTKRFGDVLAVDRLELEIEAGEVFGFLGPNGAGKTTTVRMLTALIAPTSGSARLNGFVLGRENREIRQSVGLLTETPGVYENLSAIYNLRVYAALYGIAAPEAQIQKYLSMLGLWERRNDPAGTFSKGMRQKLALARALLHEPRILFLDEPTAALDPEAARLVRDFIAGLRAEGRTIFLCTHNLAEAERLCDRVAVFKTRLLAVDTPANLRRGALGRRVVFHLGRDARPLTPLLADLPFVEACEAHESKLVVTLADPESHNPEIVRLLVAQGVDIQFIGELRRSLEDVYLNLVH